MTTYFKYGKTQRGSVVIQYKKETIIIQTSHLFVGDEYIIEYKVSLLSNIASEIFSF